MNRFGSIWSVFLLGILVNCSAGIQGLSVTHCFGQTNTTLNCSHSGLRKIHIDEVVHGFFYSDVSCLYFDIKSQSCEEEATALLIQTCDNRETCVLSSDIHLSCNFSASAIKIEYQCGQQGKVAVQVGVPLAVVLTAGSVFAVVMIIRNSRRAAPSAPNQNGRPAGLDNNIDYDQLVSTTKPSVTTMAPSYDALHIYENTASREGTSGASTGTQEYPLSQYETLAVGRGHGNNTGDQDGS